jgi:hypothetical protein
MDLIQPCRYKCGKQLQWVGKDPEIEHDTGWREQGTDIPHTYARCDEVKAQNIKRQQAEIDRRIKIQKIKDEHGGGLDSFYGPEV